MKNRLLVCWLLLHGSLAGQSAVKKTVCASGCDYAATRAGFTSALSAAAAAQASTCAPYIIEIAAGATIEVSADTIHLPAKSCKQYVTIRSSGVGAFTDGVRLNPTTQSGSLATIKALDYVGALIDIAEGATTSYWRFEGIDFWVYGGTAGYPNYYGILIDSNSAAVGMDRSTRPHHFEIQHCWFRGEPGKRNALNGIGVGGNNVRILDSYFEAWAGATTEARSIGIGNSDGPVEVRNNRLTGAAQNVLTGGISLPRGLLPSFLTFVGNRMGRDPYMRFMAGAVDPTTACREGQYWQNTTTQHDWVCNSSGVWVDQAGLTGYGGNIQKVIWESKVSRGVRLYGNLFEDAWYPGTWNSADFIMVNQQPQYTLEPWLTNTDLRIWGNKFTHGNQIMAIGYPDPAKMPCTADNPTNCMYTGANNIRMWDNLGYDLADARDLYPGGAGTGGFAYWAVGTFDMEYRNNTFLLATTEGSGATWGLGYAWRSELRSDHTNLQKVYGQNVLRDNIAPAGAMGLMGELGDGGTWMGECTLALAMLPGVGGYDARNNIWTNDLNWNYAREGWGGTKSPLNCGWTMFDPPTDFSQWWQHSTVLQAKGTTVVDSGTHKVKVAYQGTGSDGHDPGANIDLVNWATAGAATGAANPFLGMKIRSIRASSNTATLYVTAPSSQACAVELSRSNRFDTLAGSAEYFQTGKDVRANVSGLTPGTYYFVRARCDGYQLESTLLTSP